MAKGVEEIVKLARAVAKRAYAPYSDYQVGACLQAAKGDYYQGCNIESITFSATNHAEESAIVNAVVGGAIERAKSPQFITQIAVVTKEAAAPCGICLQRISEHAAPDCQIVCANLQGQVRQIYRLSELLPEAFNTELK